jgi:hypothetical protein
MQHLDILHLLDDLMPEEVRERMRTRTRERSMENKVFEIRDRMTFIVALGVKIEAGADHPGRLLWRVGYGPAPGSWLMLARLCGGVFACHDDAHDWRDGSRTMFEAHKYIEANWGTLENGAVVDVEYILGETTKPKESEVSESKSLKEANEIIERCNADDSKVVQYGTFEDDE